MSQFFGNEIKEVSPSAPEIAAKFPSIRKIFQKSSARLFRDYSLTIVNKVLPRVKSRMDIFRENVTKPRLGSGNRLMYASVPALTPICEGESGTGLFAAASP